MTIKSFKRPGQLSTENVLLAANIEDFTRQLVINPLLDGRHFVKIDLTSSTPKLIPHTLGRPWVGWIVVNQNANANVWVSSNNNNQTNLTLRSNANVTIYIFIF
jgi:hypothetical protein